MIKSVLLIGLGAAGALQADRWLQKTKTRMSPRAVTDALIDKVNSRLEEHQVPSR
ncbi:MAG: hypothetical protein QOH26_1860 [Actinomycetota bacterium]|jgi:hypothetical protein|nr:hypothetical protein [Actinomycetota bacterium]